MSLRGWRFLPLRYEALRTLEVRAISLLLFPHGEREYYSRIGGGGLDDCLDAFMDVHLQETFSDVVKTDKTGLSKTAHTRWMISAFANFLPGSTIFRLA